MRSVGICLGEEPRPFMYNMQKKCSSDRFFTDARFAAREARE